MTRRTRGVLLIVSLAVALVASLAVAIVGSLAVARAVVPSEMLTQALGHHGCEIGFRNLIAGCTFESSRTITTAPSGSFDETSWTITNHCPRDNIAKRLLCTAAPAGDDLEAELSEATG